MNKRKMEQFEHLVYPTSKAYGGKVLALLGQCLQSTGMKSLAIAAPKLPFHNHKLIQFNKFQFQCGPVFVPRTILKPPILHFHRPCYGAAAHISSAGRGYRLNVNDDSHTESYWLNLIRDGIWSIRSLLVFLVEQPSQLKYIEWPSFQSTLKTATLTLVLVALLIVALSSVDSALSYFLALLLRRKL